LGEVVNCFWGDFVVNSLLDKKKSHDINIPLWKKVCVLEVSFIWNIKRIEVPGLEFPYWVEKDAITQAH